MEELTITSRDASSCPTMGAGRKSTDQKNLNLDIPQGYHSKARRIWHYYKVDPLFGYLVDREVDFAVTKLEWILPFDRASDSWFSKVLETLDPREKSKIKEEHIWEEWAEIVNLSVSNVLPGLPEVLTWIMRSLLLTSMAAVEWTIGDVKIGKKSYKLPNKILVHPSSAIKIQKYSNNFGDEDFYVYHPIIHRNPWAWKHEIKDADKSQQDTEHHKLRHRWLQTVGQRGKENAFVARFNWSPGNLSDREILSEYEGASSGGQGASSYLYWEEQSNSYPHLTFERLLAPLMLREQLFASDASILDGIINIITLFQYGTDEHPAKPSKRDSDGKLISGQEGDLYWLRKVVEESLVGNSVNLYMDHKTTVETLERDTATLLSNTKYMQSTVEILQFFGIMGSEWKGRTQYDEINASNQEERFRSLRRHTLSIMSILIDQVRRKNPELKYRPIPNFEPVNIRPVQWWELMRDLRKMGQISNNDLLRQVGLKQDSVVSRMSRELQSGIKEMQDQASPVQYVQTTTDSKNKKVSDNRKDGRPPEKIGE